MTIFSFGGEWKSEKTELSQRALSKIVSIKNAKGLKIFKSL